MSIPLFWRVLPFYLVIGFLCAVPVYQQKSALTRAKAAGKVAEAQLTSSNQSGTQLYGTPTRIVIPNHGIDVAIVGGHFNSGSKTWTVSPIYANYATNSFPVNNVANKTFIYGHWTRQVFGNTKDLKEGDTAYVYTTEGHIFEYTFKNTDIVNPNDEHVLQNLQGDPGMVLMTCTGQWAQNRRVMHFELVRAS